MATVRGRLLGERYRLKEILGEGAMSTVSRAHDELLDRPVAVKLLKPAFARDGEFVERFYGEARVAARLVHPHVVGIFDVLADGRSHGIVMELVEGDSLANILEARGPLDEREAIRYARSVAAALSAAHAAGVVHGDIKPANVLLGPDGSVKVTDFGLGPGSPRYASPEQLRGESLTASSDLYSLGALIEQMTARPSSRLRSIVERLMQPRPEDRFAGADEAEGALASLDRESGAPAAFVESPTLLVNPQPASPPRTQSSRGFVLPTLAWGEAAEHLKRISERSVEPRLELAAAWMRGADRRYVWLAGALLCLGVLVLAAAARPRVPVADVRSQTVAAARARLERQGMQPSVVTRTDERVPAGHVISQEPAAGTGLHSGDGVRLVVSGGLPLVQVPNLVGRMLSDANRAVFAAKLRPAYAARIAGAPPNTVIEEIPAPGTRLRERSAVLLVLSTGPRPRIIYSGGDGGD